MSEVAQGQLETCASALLLSTLFPSQAPKDKGWLDMMECLSTDSRAAYKAIIAHPKFEDYFHHVTPETELSTITLVDKHWNNERRTDVVKWGDS